MESNPYEAANTEAANTMGQLPYARIAPTPIKYMKQSYRMIQEQYFLFFGITLVALLLGALAPMGILLGPMIIGIYLCFLAREADRPVNFDLLFRGFDHFLPSLWVMLTMLLCNVVVTVLFLMLAGLFGLMFVSMMQANGPPAFPAYLPFVAIGVGYCLLILCSILSIAPFAFCFQLIAEHQMSASDAMKTSIRAVIHNAWPLALTFLSISFFGMLAALFCYLPLFFLMPIQIGATFVIYREIFPKNSNPNLAV